MNALERHIDTSHLTISAHVSRLEKLCLGRDFRRNIKYLHIFDGFRIAGLNGLFGLSWFFYSLPLLSRSIICNEQFKSRLEPIGGIVNLFKALSLGRSDLNSINSKHPSI